MLVKRPQNPSCYMKHACYTSVENDCNIRLTCMLPGVCYCLLDAFNMHDTCALFRIGRMQNWIEVNVWSSTVYLVIFMKVDNIS